MSQFVSTIPAAPQWKLALSGVIAGPRAGRVIGAVTRNRLRHRGLWFDTRDPEFTASVRAQMFWGGYESGETRAIKAQLRGAATVVELGSSLGVTSAHIAARLAPGGRLICVEANPRLIPGLRRRVADRFPAVRVDVVHAAIAADDRGAVLQLADETVGSRLASPDGPVRDGRVPVPSLALRDLIRAHGITRYDLVSDIEGGEAAFLLGDPGVLGGCGRLVLELHDTQFRGAAVRVADLLAAARAAGFGVVSQDGAVFALRRT